MAYTQENIQFSKSVVKYKLLNYLNFLTDMGSLSGAGRLFHNIGPSNLIDRFPNVDYNRTSASAPAVSPLDVGGVVLLGCVSVAAAASRRSDSTSCAT